MVGVFTQWKLVNSIKKAFSSGDVIVSAHSLVVIGVPVLGPNLPIPFLPVSLLSLLPRHLSFLRLCIRPWNMSLP